MGFTRATSNPSANPPRQGGFSRRPGINPDAYRMDEAPGSHKAAPSPSTAGSDASPAALPASSTAATSQPATAQPTTSVVRAFGKRPDALRAPPAGPAKPAQAGGPVLPATLNACIERMAVEKAWTPEKIQAAKVRAMRDPVTAEKAYREALGLAQPPPPVPAQATSQEPRSTGSHVAASLREAIEQNPGKTVFAVKRTESDGVKVAFSVEERGACDILHGLLFESVPAQSDAFGKDVFDKPLPGQQVADQAAPSAANAQAEAAQPPATPGATRAVRGRSP